MNRGQPLQRRAALRPGKPPQRAAFLPAGTATWPPRRQTPLPRVGRRGKTIEADLDALTDALRRRSGGWCEIRVPGVCTGWATDRCHRQRRTVRNGVLSNVLHGCRACHDWQPQHLETARRHGFVVSAWGDPTTIPVVAFDPYGLAWQPHD